MVEYFLKRTAATGRLSLRMKDVARSAADMVAFVIKVFLSVTVAGFLAVVFFIRGGLFLIPAKMPAESEQAKENPHQT